MGGGNFEKTCISRGQDLKSSIQSILLNGAEAQKISKENEKKLLATEMKYMRRRARASRLERKANIEIRNQQKVKIDIITKND